MPRRTRGKSIQKIVHAARANRREMTPAEKALWDALRNRRLAGLKFRRQHPVDRFILDYFCVEKQLVVEVDGGIHNALDQAAQDTERTAWLKTRGIRVLRFDNEKVLKRLDEVLKQIVRVASSTDPFITE